MTAAILPFLFILTSALAPGAAAEPARDAALDQEFEIRVGQWVTIEGERLRVTLSRVAEDSRCPEGVQCIWAGNAKVVLKLSKARRRASTLSLNTGVDPRQGSYRGYEVRLVKLDPYPKENRPIRRRDYVATLVVSRR
ncbi:MAG TPA: hypothetical protein VN256_02635 [Pyrinomonadaceae bacterium]|nr:hypothetical protein [Pyrinomonadaceae bacterium]